jgi:hypothetical protein
MCCSVPIATRDVVGSTSIGTIEVEGEMRLGRSVPNALR